MSVEPPMAIRSVMCLLLAGTGLLVGCGEEPLTTAEYEAEIRPIASSLESLGDLPPVSTFGDESLAEDLEAKADDAAEAADALDGIQPPEFLGSEHDQLIDLMEEVETGLDDAAAASLEEDTHATDEALGVAASALDEAARSSMR